MSIVIGESLEFEGDFSNISTQQLVFKNTDVFTSHIRSITEGFNTLL